MSLPWKTLRPWKDSLNSAFEELCCQLAEYEQHPQGSVFVRKGTPDAGVECFWIFPTGSEWGWQAKFFSLPLGSTQWQQLDESVYSALEKHPNLNRYTICLPFDRPDARVERQESFLDLWNARVKKWQTRARQLGRSIQFEYWGDHEIQDRLSRAEHAGRYKFWFDKEFLSRSWFATHIREVVANAGDRYTPILNVDLPISQVFDGLGRTPGFFSSLDTQIRTIRKSFRYLSWKKLAEISETHFKSLASGMARLFELLAGMRDHGWKQLPFADLAVAQIESAQRCVEALRKQQNDNGPSTPIAEPSQPPAVDLRNEIYELEQLLRSLYALRHFSESSSARLSNRPSLLIVGGAGVGKTHLFCDVAEQRIKKGYPTVVLLGEQFRVAEPWKQILELLNLNCTREEFLGALDAAAQASGTRALIAIDALNEGGGASIWIKHLPGILSHLEQYPRISIAVSVRTSYEPIIVSPALVSDGKVIRQEHYGFEEHEYEAANRFFTHFGIEPSVPLLFPEFKNPQFLLLFCKGIRNRGLSRVPPGLHGIMSIFEFYLDSVNIKLAHPAHLNFDVKERLVQNATEIVTKLMAARTVRWLPLKQTRKSIDALLPGRNYEGSLFRHLIAEGVLTGDLFLSNRKHKLEEGGRFTYERFADHQIVQLKLKSSLDRKHPERSFKVNRPLGMFLRDERECWRNQGLIEALCIQIPDLVQKELPELAPYASGFRAVRLAFVDSLIWRTRNAFGTSTLKYINTEVLADEESTYRFWDAVLTLAPVQGHPLNAGFLHNHLSAFTMPDRDAWWSTYIHRQYGEKLATDRLLDWAWSPLAAHNLDRESAVLCAIAMAWLLTTSNRFLRDKATKTLVRVIDSRIDVLLPLLNKFRTVNDPYVLERLCAVAYGCAMKSTDASQLRELAKFVYDWIFARGEPHIHILVRDYARGVIEWALQRGPQPAIDLSKIRPPYKSAWPKSIPSRNELEAKYGTSTDKMPDEEWARISIYESVMGHGDFARYVIGTNSGHFEWSPTRLGKHPQASPQDKYNAFLGQLDGKKKRVWDKLDRARSEAAFAQFSLMLHEKGGPSTKAGRVRHAPAERLREAEKAFEAILNQKERSIYRKDVLTYLVNQTRTEKKHFDLTIAQR